MDLLKRWSPHSLRYEMKCASFFQDIPERRDVPGHFTGCKVTLVGPLSYNHFT